MKLIRISKCNDEISTSRREKCFNKVSRTKNEDSREEREREEKKKRTSKYILAL